MARAVRAGLLAAATLAAGPGGATADTAADVQKLLADAWEFQLREEPLFATRVGDARYDDRLPSVAPADFERRAAFWKQALARAESFDEGALSATERASLRIFRLQAKDEIEEVRFRTWRSPLNAEGGFYSGFARLADEAPLRTTRDYENYLARLRAFPAYADQQVRNLEEGLKTGFTPPRVTLSGIEATIAAHVAEDVEKSAFWKPFASFPTTVPAADHDRLRAAARAAIAGDVVPAYRRIRDFVTARYLPGARTTVGASELPEGREFYAWCVRHFTTLDATADEVHALGLREVARIRGEMDAVVKAVGWDKAFPAFLEFLRTDPRFYPKTAEELLSRASLLAKKMDGQLPALFKTLPRQPYGVEPVPADLAPRYTAGRYNGAPVGGTRAGMYWVNTYALPTRTLYTLEALTLHEAVPGHHLQIALQQELVGLPPFRRHLYVDAFGEGWGLYSERLGLEAGFYQDPYSNFGRLTYEMWRACRLVVDTGLHAKGWTRQQALDYLASNTALSLHEVTTETDRYIAWPGQALAYKMGELKIRALRKKAEEALGSRFDVREFHDAVLGQGSVPLPVLEGQVDAYIATAQARP